VRRIVLVEEPTDVVPPERMIYSTRPKRALGEDGIQYYLKGPDPAVVAAEALAYELGGLVGFTTPDYGLCEVPEAGLCFASREIRFRSALDTILEKELAANPELIPACIAFDIWIVNDDRNISNIVAEPVRVGASVRARLHAIDFEKSKILRGSNMFEVGMVDPRTLWPKELLGRLCRGCNFPDDFCERVRAITRDQIDGVFERLIWELAGLDLPWRESAVFQLSKRATEIRQRAQEVWDYGRR
jgi:hypothetical protein